MNRRLLAVASVVSLAVTVVLAWGATSTRPPVDRWTTTPSTASMERATRVVSNCVTATESSCLTDAFTRSLETNGPVATLRAYDAVRISHPLMANHCHTAGHTAGRLAFSLAGDDVARALVMLEPICQSAYSHGVLDAWARAFDDSVSPSQVQAEFAAVMARCERTPAGDARSLCFDGIGHATLLFQRGFVESSSDLPDDEVLSRAVGLCGSASRPDGREGCVAGILMQLFAPVVSTGTTRAADDLGAFCAAWDLAWWPEAFQSVEEGVSLTVRSACRGGTIYPLLTAFGATNPSRIDDRIEWYLDECDALADPRDPESSVEVGYCRGALGYALLYTAGLDTTTALEWCRDAVEVDSSRAARQPLTYGTCRDKVLEVAASNGA